jgi:hypothetical protein
MSVDDYEVEVTLYVTASSEIEAKDAVKRSGITTGALIGECLVAEVAIDCPTNYESE